MRRVNSYNEFAKGRDKLLRSSHNLPRTQERSSGSAAGQRSASRRGNSDWFYMLANRSHDFRVMSLIMYCTPNFSFDVGSEKTGQLNSAHSFSLVGIYVFISDRTGSGLKHSWVKRGLPRPHCCTEYAANALHCSKVVYLFMSNISAKQPNALKCVLGAINNSMVFVADEIKQCELYASYLTGNERLTESGKALVINLIRSHVHTHMEVCVVAGVQ
jgi:hypothetical protein